MTIDYKFNEGQIIKELKQYVDELLTGKTDLNEDQLASMINSTTREMSVYNYILKLIVCNSNVN